MEKSFSLFRKNSKKKKNLNKKKSPNKKMIVRCKIQKYFFRIFFF